MKAITEILQQDFSVAEADIEKAQAYQQKYPGRLEQILVNMGALADDRLPQFYAHLLNLPIITQSQEQYIDELIGDNRLNVTAEVQSRFKQLGCLVVNLPDDAKDAYLAIVLDPLDLTLSELLEDTFDSYVVVIASKPQFEKLSQVIFHVDFTDLQHANLSSIEEEKLRELASEAPTVSLLNALITRALREGASDMHIEPLENVCQVRFRVDGVLKSEDTIPQSMQLPLITRIKILSGMDIAEKRRPQDGKIELKIAQKEMDIRVSCLPLNQGESVVMRFLLKDALNYDMETLGMAADVRALIEQDLAKTAGVVLLTGPTGSGKTTSLYTFLSDINSEEVKIITLEDPVEYQLHGVNQVQVKPEIGFDFAAGLRSIVRQDPDVIMVGEIRDQETARIALQSAITGHLVFSTVHTNDAPSAFTRLLDLGVDEFLLNAALISIIAQRLVRTLCQCKRPMNQENAEKLMSNQQLLSVAQQYNDGNVNLFEPVGCEACNHSGYKGRRAVIEYLPCDEALQAIPKDETFLEQARRHNQKLGNRTMVEDGLLKVAQGLTTLDEVLRVAG